MTTEYMVDTEIGHVLAALTPINALVCRVCLATGLRVGDVVSLRTADLKKGRQFYVVEQKTKKKRRVNLSEELRIELLEGAGDIFVFPGRTSQQKHRSRQAVWKDLKRAAKAFRLPQNIGPHSLRKVFAVELLQRYRGDLPKLQKALNHSNPATTLIYAMALTNYEIKYKGKGGKRRGGRSQKKAGV